jgi:hypothetical protein
MSVSKNNPTDVCDLLNAAPVTDRVSTTARVALSQRNPLVDYPVYFAALDYSLKQEPPPFGTQGYSDVYQEASAFGQWLAVSLITNAEREGDGATRLWSLAAFSIDEEERELLKRHAVDESRHALAYLKLLDLSFPEAVSPSFRSDLNQLSPHYSVTQKPSAVPGSPYARTPSIDDYMQMNIAEIRTTLHHLMQRAAIEQHCPAENWQSALRILNSLLMDELNHVAYTAVLIEKKAGEMQPDKFRTQFSKRLRDFNQITESELGQLIFE